MTVKNKTYAIGHACKQLARMSFLFLCFTIHPWSNNIQAEQKDTLIFRVMFYNTENLFDTKHDSLKNDTEYLPEATRHWTQTRYMHKLNNIARAIISTGAWNMPALVGLCEIENDHVLQGLTRYSPLRKAGYRYVMTHSKDIRGIDVALLYRRELFQLLTHQSLHVPLPKGQNNPTRDILHVSGRLLTLDTLDIFICHFPSRRNGKKASEPYRMNAAYVVRKTIDSLLQIRQYPQILLMGDFNDTPQSRPIRQALQVQTPPTDTDSHSLHAHTLYHLFARQASIKKKIGTYKYHGRWEWLDHIIVSGNLLRPNASLMTNENHTHITQDPYLLSPDEKYGGQQPFRTYYGMKYLGGYSDHLPVWADFQLIY